MIDKFASELDRQQFFMHVGELKWNGKEGDGKTFSHYSIEAFPFRVATQKKYELIKFDLSLQHRPPPLLLHAK